MKTSRVVEQMKRHLLFYKYSLRIELSVAPIFVRCLFSWQCLAIKSIDSALALVILRLSSVQ